MASALLLQGMIVAIGSLLSPWLIPARPLLPSSTPAPERRDLGLTQPLVWPRVPAITPAPFSSSPGSRP